MNALERTIAAIPGNWSKGPRVEHGKGCGLALLSDNMDTEWDGWIEYRNALAATALEMFPDRTGNGGVDSFTFINFNDHPDTTEADVISVFEKASIKIEELV
jgi:hypothetical protein